MVILYVVSLKCFSGLAFKLFFFFYFSVRKDLIRLWKIVLSATFASLGDWESLIRYFLSTGGEGWISQLFLCTLGVMLKRDDDATKCRNFLSAPLNKLQWLLLQAETTVLLPIKSRYNPHFGDTKFCLDSIEISSILKIQGTPSDLVMWINVMWMVK